MSRFLTLTSLLLTGLAFASVIWIVVPAPHKYVWLYSVAVSEWSLWLGAIALTGMILALLNYAFYKSGWTTALALIIGAIALLISLYPMLSAFQAAREKHAALSFTQYFNGLSGGWSGVQPKTYVFKSNGETELKMDVYVPPENVAGRGAGVVVVHGGSWNAGARGDFPQWNLWLAANGFTVFDIDYTLAPQPNYKTAIGDVKCAVLQIKKRAAEFGISPGKVVLLGRSAGAHLALIAAYSANDAQLPPTCAEAQSRENDESVRAVVSFYAPTDLTWAYDHPANQFVIDGPQTIANLIGGSPHESDEIRARYLLASPVERVDFNSPPTLLMHGGQDQLVRAENLDLLAEKLKQAGVRHETLVIPYAQHGFDYNFYGWGSQIARPLILDFLINNTLDKKLN
ncbi:MAG TPA: alpha/beta hydrolase [Pyrinomonadaceae bacterium]|jgi:acetyl esterase/lipase